jgi:uncharacterized membrane protein (UPF0127 family)
MLIAPTTRMLMLLVGMAAMGPLGCTDANTQRVDVGKYSFDLELALDDDARTMGLMHRESIAKDGGMLFVFPNAAPRSFWMKNCLTDMDLLFLDGAGYVVAIHQMTVEPPNTPDHELPGYPSGRPAQFAIELQAGMADKTGVKVGDRITLPLADLKKRAQ